MKLCFINCMGLFSRLKNLYEILEFLYEVRVYFFYVVDDKC